MIGIEIKGDKELQAKLSKVMQGTKDLTPLHKRLGIAGQKWVAETFQKQGRPKWKPLSPNTLAARRSGGGRILQDSGLLRASYIFHATRTEATVGSSRKVALFHQEGVKPFGPILPKKKGGVLAFMTAGGMVFTRRVQRHPGIKPRPMLPTKAQAEKDITVPVGNQYLQALIKKSFGS